MLDRKTFDVMDDLISVVGVDRLCRKTETEIADIVTYAAPKGGYAFGPGNSIPDDVPYAHFIAMNKAAR